MKNRLFTPGPTPVPDEVMLRMARPLLYHRSQEFRALMRRVNGHLGYLFQTGNPILTLTCSGTGAMEALIVNLFSPGDALLAVNGGKFGARWGEIARTYGMRVVELSTPWGEPVQPGKLQETLVAHPDVRGVLLTQSETSTGTVNDIKTLARMVHEHSSALVCVDGISSIGAMEFRFDAWDIDAGLTGSQKGLMLPPGLAFVALSPRAREAARASRTPRYYFDFQKAWKALENGDTPWTPAISLLAGADESLAMIRNAGLEKIWRRHERMASGLRAGVVALGLRLFSRAPSSSLTAVILPENIAWNEFQSLLLQDEGITVAGGQGEFAGKIFRIAHLGYCDEFDIIGCVAGLERVLAKLGLPVKPGVGVSAVQETLS